MSKTVAAGTYDIYLVKSGRLDDFVGWTWLNLRAFDDYDRAVEFKNTVIKVIKPENLEVTEDVEIETITVEYEIYD